MNINFKEIEEKWKNFWEKEKIYKFNKNSKKPMFSIDTPPPTVSGKMHIGHACSFSQMDFIARFKRMIGFNLFYPFGTDDNGLATERLIEKTEKIKSKEMPREKFIEICLKFLEKERPEFIQDWKNLGISCDWDLNYSTINEHSRRISQWSFLDLYKKDRMELKDAPTMWCPECRTGVAQVEVEDKEKDSIFSDIIFKVGGKDLIIATTRPELLPACVAVFFHPEDKKYKKLEGKKAKVPLFNFEVPIIADKRVDPKKGTGIVMCCTFGDQTDMEWQKAYNLEIKEAIDRKGIMNEIAGKYQGLNVKKARKKILEDLKENKFLIREKPIKHFVNVHERCGTEIEFIKTKQWFLRYLDLKKDMLKWGSELNWNPKFMKVRYDNWVKGLQWDWLISNQRHFGIPFPVWYCANENCNEVIVADEKDLPVEPLEENPPVKECPKCNSKEFIPEKDILNTWFTSAMTPQIAIQLIDEKFQKKLFPMNLRPQAHDIISFWLFNTVVKSRLHYGKNPWKDVAISGFVTLKGEKMSKSKGNIIRPQEVMEKYCADAIRFWAASSKLGNDFDYQEKDVITGMKFIKKLINASKFVFMNLGDWDGKKPEKLEPLDESFLGNLGSKIKKITENFEKYNYSKSKLLIEKLFLLEFSADYLEMIKGRVYNEKGQKKKSAQYTLYLSLFSILKMVSPICPFITEELYQKYFKKYEKEKSIHLCKWPNWKSFANKEGGNLFNHSSVFLNKIRKEKTLAKESMNSKIETTLPIDKYKILEPAKKDLINVSGSIIYTAGDVADIEINFPKTRTEPSFNDKKKSNKP